MQGLKIDDFEIVEGNTSNQASNALKNDNNTIVPPTNVVVEPSVPTYPALAAQPIPLPLAIASQIEQGWAQMDNGAAALLEIAKERFTCNNDPAVMENLQNQYSKAFRRLEILRLYIDFFARSFGSGL